jgi:hypothetical protein
MDRVGTRPRLRVLCGADRVKNQAIIDGEPGERQNVAASNFLLTGPPA